MDDESEVIPNCNCTKTLLAVGTLRSDTEVYKTQVLIIHCVLAAAIVILAVCVALLFYYLRKLQKLVNTLDPMSKYKKVAPSVYMRKAKKEISSISSSFKHFDANINNDICMDPDGMHQKREETPKLGNYGNTLDKNFFTTSSFSFNNPLSKPCDVVSDERHSNKRKMTDPEAREALSKLDMVIY